MATVQPRFVHSAAEFRQVVEIGKTTESLVLEFKSAVDGWGIPEGVPDRDRLRREGQKELCRDVSQFANSIGGCLLVGIQEDNIPGSRLSLAKCVAPVTTPHGLKQWIEQAMKNYLVPSTFRHDIQEIELPEGYIMSVNVAPSRSLVAVWDDQSHAQEFIHRTSFGKAYMNPDDVERLRDGNLRAGKIAFDLAVEKSSCPSEVVIANDFWTEHTSLKYVRAVVAVTTIASVGEEWVNLVCTSGQGSSPTPLVVPYSLIREAWVGPTGRANLLLAARPVWHGGFHGSEYRLEPYG